MITKFADVFAELKEKGVCKKMVAAWAVDEHTIEACAKATQLGFVKVTLVGDEALISKTCQQLGIDTGMFEIVNEPVELKAVAKTNLLKPGESQTITMTVNVADLASFDETASAWVVAEGEYQFLIGASAQDIKATLSATAKAQQTKVHDVMKPDVQLNLLRR